MAHKTPSQCLACHVRSACVEADACTGWFDVDFIQDGRWSSRGCGGIDHVDSIALPDLVLPQIFAIVVVT